MDAKEREVGIGDGIDEVADLVLGVVVEFVVVTTEADDFLTKFDAVFFCETVSLEATTNDQMLRHIFGLGSRHKRALTFGGEIQNFFRKMNGGKRLNAECDLNHFLCGRDKIYDAGTRHPKRCLSPAFGFDIAELVRVDQLDAFDFILKPQAMNFIQRSHFRSVGSNDHLATDIVGNVMLFCKTDELMSAFDTVLGLQRSRFVVKSRVDNARVVTGLVCSKGRHFINQQHLLPRKPFLHLVKRGRPYNTASNHNNIVILHQVLFLSQRYTRVHTILSHMLKIFKKEGPEKVKWGWAMYDWANNVYSLVITTAIFPVFYNSLTSEKDANGMIIDGTDNVMFLGMEFVNTQLYSYVLATSFLTIIIISPLLSGLADYAGKKKLFMRIFCYIGSAGCVGLYWFDADHLELSMVPFFLASLGFWGSVGFYNAFLPEIAPREEHDRLSAKGYAMGYWSSLIILVICAGMIIGVGTHTTTFCFVLVGLWWFGFAHITFNALPESEIKDLPPGNILAQGFKELVGVARELKGYVHLKRYLGAFFVMSMAIQTIIIMASSFGIKEVGLDEKELIITIFVVNLLAIPGAFGLSAVSRRIGNIKALMTCIVGWAALCLYAYFFATTKMGFYVAAGAIGFLMGGTQSLNRATYSKILPTTKDPASYFSFYEVLEKGGLIIGMFGWGYIEGYTGSMRESILAMIILFSLAFIAMLMVPKAYRNKVHYAG